MKKIILPLLAISIGFTSCKKVEEVKTEPADTSTEVVVEETVEVAPDSATVAKAWQDYATPSKAHKMLANDTGTWDAEMTFWTPDNPEPQKATSVAEYKMILDGKYQEGIFKGDMWGMSFEGRGMTAYDNASKEYITTWIDNMGTGMMVSRGHYDEATKSMTFKGAMVDPVTGKEKKVKEVITYIDDNTQKMEMFDIDANGKESKNMEINSKRRK
jgi:hypothetical protein